MLKILRDGGRFVTDCDVSGSCRFVPLARVGGFTPEVANRESLLERHRSGMTVNTKFMREKVVCR